MAIHFFEEETTLKLNNSRKVKLWLKELAMAHGYKLGNLNYIFCSDNYLYQINIQYLNHHTHTDIITFDQSDQPGIIEGDIYVSIDRIKENAKEWETSFEKELFRVISHGLLHLCGFSDKSEIDKAEMRNQENLALEKLKSQLNQATVPRGTVEGNKK
ncbi:MAG: rRNA maturation RNase YbeY [Cyclobacteriaceae bacterium]